MTLSSYKKVFSSWIVHENCKACKSLLVFNTTKHIPIEEHLKMDNNDNIWEVPNCPKHTFLFIYSSGN
jgi:hypothetical protein